MYGKAQGVYSDEELDVKLTHVEPKTTSDKTANAAVGVVRLCFDVVVEIWTNHTTQSIETSHFLGNRGGDSGLCGGHVSSFQIPADAYSGRWNAAAAAVILCRMDSTLLFTCTHIRGVKCLYSSTNES